MIEVNDKGQVYVKLGHGDVGEACVIYDDENVGALCFEQLDYKWEVGSLVNQDFDIDNQKVIIEFSGDSIRAIDLMISKLKKIKDAMLYPFDSTVL